MNSSAGHSIWNTVAKRIVAVAAGFALGSMAATAAQAQTSASATTGASVTIAAPIAVTKTADLSFGMVVPSATAGTVVVSAAGVRSVSGGVSEFGGTVTAAAYSVTGYASNAYAIALPTTATLTGPGSTTMTAGTFTHSAGSSPALDSSGNGTFSVGATLSVGANQAAGAYSGTFDVSVNYN
ncbi:MAG: DUF4402 domain-containing protein [Rhodospirillales bacterium]|jgi:hypothetical protein|nr:DUF4402 domain-containing protein [Rhodospirillales bacterium]